MATLKKRTPKRGKAVTAVTKVGRGSGRPRTPWQPVFLEVLATSGNITLSAHKVGISRVQAHRTRATNKAFAALWDEAIEESMDLLEAEARRRAAVGVVRNVYHQGKVVGHEKHYSDTLLIFLLKGGRPEKYRENVNHKHDGNVNVAVQKTEERRLTVELVKSDGEVYRIERKGTAPVTDLEIIEEVDG